MSAYSKKQQEEEKIEVFRNIYYELVQLNEKVNNLTIGDLKQDKTALLLRTKNYLGTYKTKFSEMLKEKFKFDVKSLEENIKIAEESIEILKR